MNQHPSIPTLKDGLHFAIILTNTTPCHPYFKWTPCTLVTSKEGLHLSRLLRHHSDHQTPGNASVNLTPSIIIHLERRPPPRLLRDGGVEDGEVDERVGGHEEVGQDGGHEVKVA